MCTCHKGDTIEHSHHNQLFDKNNMTRLDTLKEIYAKSSLASSLTVKKDCDYPDRNFSALRFESNDFRIRAIEIWDRQTKDSFFRIYHAPKIAPEIKNKIDEIESLLRSQKQYSDYGGDFTAIATQLAEIVTSGTTKEIAKNNIVLTRNSKYEGLSLPDIDTSEDDVVGRVFTWKEIIAIDEDQTPENELKKSLSQNGVYLQRSLDGTSRYVGSAYGSGGILGRWLKHLTSNGNAKHLNLYVLENGYANMVFTVLEFTDKENSISSEQKWKQVLGTQNNGPYDGIRLNSN